MPNHTHLVRSISKPGDSGNPEQRLWAASSAAPMAYSDAQPDTAMASEAIAPVGGNLPHDNMMPSLCIHFIIALFGIFPSRT
jgi:microcystin-dependent protein